MGIVRKIYEKTDDGVLSHNIGTSAENVLESSSRRFITDTERTSWNNKSDNGHTHTVVNGHTVESDVPANAKFTDTTYSIMVGATDGVNGSAGLVPAPLSGMHNSFLKGDGTWGAPDIVTYNVVTTSVNGLMSYTDKIKLDGIATGANNYSHPGYTSRTSGLYKITVDSTGHVSNVSAVTKSDITALGIPGEVVLDDMVGATYSTDGVRGLVPAPKAGEQSLFLRGDGLWETPLDTTYDIATVSANGLMSRDDKVKLNSIAANANYYVHPSTHPATMIVEDSTHRFATDSEKVTWNDKYSKNEIDNKFSTLETNIDWKESVDTFADIATTYPSPQDGWTVNTKDDNVTWRYNGTTWVGISANAIPNATSSIDGLMSSSDKSKLDGIAPNANNYSHPSYTSRSSGLYKVTVDATGHVSNIVNVSKSDITNLGIPAQDTTYSTATSSVNGLMSSSDKAKLDGIAAGATAYSHPTYTSRNAGLYKVTVDGYGHVSNVSAVTKADITALGIPSTNTTYGVFGAATSAAAGTSGLVPAPAAGNNNNFLRGDGTWGAPDVATYSTATTSANGLMSYTDKIKLDGIATGANNYSHPGYTARANGLYKVTVDSSGHVSGISTVTKADITALGIPAQDTNTTYSVMTAATSSAAGTSGLVPAPGSGKQLSFLRGDGTWVVPTNTTYSVATTSANGLMSSTDKTKLDGIATGANKYIHPTYTSRTAGLYKVTVDGYGHVSTVDSVTKTDITALGIPAQDTTYSVATTSANGLMSYSDKVKLNNIATGANNYSHPTYTSRSSGLYKVTVDSTGHVSAVNAVTKADITALGIPAQDTNTTYTVGTTSTLGLTKLYTATGTATDGTMTQSAINTALASKAASSHTHSAGSISSVYGHVIQRSSSYSIAGNTPPFERGVYNITRANRLAFLPASGIVIERTDDGGTTWYDAGYSDTDKVKICDERRSIGFTPSSGTVTTNKKIRFTFKPVDRYTSVDQLLIYMCNFGHGTTIDIERSTIGAKDTFTTIRSGVTVTGWTHNNVINFPVGSFGGGNNQTSNFYSYRITLNITSVNSSYPTSVPNIHDIRFYGEHVWSFGNNLMYNDHLYSWDSNQNATFPAQLTATSFNGQATRALQDSSSQQINSTYIKGLSVSGKVITYTKGDGTTGTITTQDTNTTYSVVTTSANGLMLATDKVKLNGIATGANNYSHPTYTSRSSGLYKVTVDATGHVSAVTAVSKSDITALGIPSTNTTYSVATTTTNGLMSATDKTKLDGISTVVELTRAEYNALVAAGTVNDSVIYIVTDDFDSSTVINDTTASNTTTYSSNKITAIMKSTKYSLTMSASAWTGTEAPYKITLSAAAITATNNIEVVPPGTLTNEQVEAWMGAQIFNGTQSAGKVTLNAYGEIPAIDIPVELIVRGD